MGYRLGVDLGTTFTAAVIQRPGSQPRPVPLGERSAAVPTVLYLGPDGSVLIGEAAERRAVTDPDRVVRRFKRRIGDETPLLVGAEGERWTAHALAARMIALIADQVSERQGEPPSAIAVTVPAAWGPHKRDLLAAALAHEGLVAVTFVPEPEAAALAAAQRSGTHRTDHRARTTLAVYDFGGGTFDAAVVRVEDSGQCVQLGRSTGLPDLGGIDFDDAVLGYLLGALGPDRLESTSDDPLQVAALARLRRECTEAKEGLSADTTVAIPVLLGEIQTSVRLTRAEFEAMITAALEQTLGALDAALSSAGIGHAELGAILLIGGSSRIPLVSQLLSARFPGVHLERDLDPKFSVAAGGALALPNPNGQDSAAPPMDAAPPRPPQQSAPLAVDREVEPPARRTPALAASLAVGLLLTGGAFASIWPWDSSQAGTSAAVSETDREARADRAKAPTKQREQAGAEDGATESTSAGLAPATGTATSSTTGEIDAGDRSATAPSAGADNAARATTPHTTGTHADTATPMTNHDAATPDQSAVTNTDSSAEHATTSDTSSESAEVATPQAAQSPAAAQDPTGAADRDAVGGAETTAAPTKNNADLGDRAAADATNQPARQPRATTPDTASGRTEAAADLQSASTDSGTVEAFDDGSSTDDQPAPR